MNDRMHQIILGLQAAGEGSFQISLSPTGEWVTAAVYGREAEDSPMAGAASYGVANDPWTAVRQVLDETRWGDL